MVKHKVCPWKRSPDCPEASPGGCGAYYRKEQPTGRGVGPESGVGEVF